jgi:predicted nucleotidyltransferase
VDEFDYSGWDLKKSLYLAYKSNPVFFEWLKSPLVYRKDEYCHNIMLEISKECFSPISSVYHYLHMATGNYRKYLQTDQVRSKKYFYVLRPILACMWIERYNETPPMEFEKLLALIADGQLLDAVLELLAKKKSSAEMELEPKIQIINGFLEEQIQRFETQVNCFDRRARPSQEMLDGAFVKMLDYLWK